VLSLSKRPPAVRSWFDQRTTNVLRAFWPAFVKDSGIRLQVVVNLWPIALRKTKDE
jgi:hypothetical protein